MTLPRYKLIAVFVMLLIAGMVSEGTTSEVGLTSSLMGLKGVTVGVSLQGFNETGITKDDVRVAVEVELRKAGIRVYNLSVSSEVKEWIAQGQASLVVSFMETKASTQSAAMLSLALMQHASLLRNGTEVGAITWIGNVGYVNYKGDALLNDLRNVVNSFINDYLAVNPKK